MNHPLQSFIQAPTALCIERRQINPCWPLKKLQTFSNKLIKWKNCVKNLEKNQGNLEFLNAVRNENLNFFSPLFWHVCIGVEKLSGTLALATKMCKRKETFFFSFPRVFALTIECELSFYIRFMILFLLFFIRIVIFIILSHSSHYFINF